MFEVVNLPSRHCIELHLLVRGKGDNWRAEGVQHRAFLQDGTVWGSYQIKLGDCKPFDRRGASFAIKIKDGRARFYVDEVKQYKFDLPPSGVVVVVRLHEGGIIKLLHDPRTSRSCKVAPKTSRKNPFAALF
jgi:hypothetical protein